MRFVSRKETLTATTHLQRSKSRRSSGLNISYFVYNHSYKHIVLVRLVISPNRRVWMADGSIKEVRPRQLAILVPNYSSKYCALEYKSARPGCPARISVWFQRLG